MPINITFESWIGNDTEGICRRLSFYPGFWLEGLNNTMKKSATTFGKIISAREDIHSQCSNYERYNDVTWLSRSLRDKSLGFLVQPYKATLLHLSGRENDEGRTRVQPSRRTIKCATAGRWYICKEISRPEAARVAYHLQELPTQRFIQLQIQRS